MKEVLIKSRQEQEKYIKQLEFYIKFFNKNYYLIDEEEEEDYEFMINELMKLYKELTETKNVPKHNMNKVLNNANDLYYHMKELYIDL
jgi:hypothetical protein